MLNLLKIKNVYYLPVIIGLYITYSIIYNHIFISETIWLQWYDGILNQTQIQETISFVKKWEWSIVLLNVSLIFIKITFVAVFLYLGLFFFLNRDNAYKVSFNVALKSEILYVVYLFLRLLWYTFVHAPESLEEMQIMPLSLMIFFDPETIEAWLIYPLNTLNLFEILYIWMLSASMSVAVQINFRKAFELVFVSYGTGLLLLMATQMFLILNNT